MTDENEPTSAQAADAATDGAADGDGIERGVLVEARNPAANEVPFETVTAPAKVMRIGSMVKQLLDEVRSADFDEASRERLAEIYERSIVELCDALSPDLQEELHMLALPFKDGEPPSIGEIRIAKAQLVGWLEGLFHGIQATLFAQQIAARQQFEQMRGIAPGGGEGAVIDPRLIGGPGASQAAIPDRPGTYL
ncbi:unannotated protein [freshwater metagenome]|uniref:Unannotated protein n=1 Tax=freshwater metagenome TaxID=449393 RepID=A0A6J7F4L2_9ZZZZ|nr:DUF2587 domain-containing protein [Actinomycetota bacterium]